MMRLLYTFIVVVIAATSTAFAQDDPHDPQDPARALTPLRISVVVTHADGLAWMSPVTVLVKNESIGFRSYLTATPDATGKVTGELSLDRSTTESGALVAVEVWHSRSWALVDSVHQYYLNAADGMAAFPGTFKPSWSDALNAYEINTTCAMSPPPLYGDLLISAPYGQPASLAMLDFEQNEYPYWAQRVPDTLLRSIGSTSCALSVYRWRRVAATRIAILGPQRTTIGSAVLRRTAVLPVTVKRENQMTLRVDRLVYPAEYKLVVVRPEHHVPDPASADGSAVSFDMQSTRVRAVTKCKPGNGLFNFSFYLDAGDYVVELWERGVDAQGYTRYRLITAEAVVSTTVDPTITFD